MLSAREKLLKPLPVLDQDAEGNRSSGVKGCCDPSRQYAPPGTYFFVFLETAAQPLTSLSTKPLDLIPNNPTVRPPFVCVNRGGPEECRVLHF